MGGSWSGWEGSGVPQQEWHEFTPMTPQSDAERIQGRIDASRNRPSQVNFEQWLGQKYPQFVAQNPGLYPHAGGGGYGPGAVRGGGPMTPPGVTPWQRPQSPGPVSPWSGGRTGQPQPSLGAGGMGGGQNMNNDMMSRLMGAMSGWNRP
jgi:hypothetical protein